MHPYLAQTELLEYCRGKGIVVTAYSPSGRWQQVRSDPTIVSLAAKYRATRTQIILAWHLARGVVAIPKSADIERQKENIAVRTVFLISAYAILKLLTPRRIIYSSCPR
jgi:glycerol 2-dehydrogenase (NADP+)